MKMSEPVIRVVGGTMLLDRLTSVENEKTFNIAKAHCWFYMLQDKKVPTKWYKPTKKGTKIAFIYPKTQKEYDDSLADLKGFILTVNEKYGTDLYIG
jgi:hypothetical protein